MRKSLFWLFSTLLFVLPAVAQRGQRGQQQHQTFGVQQRGNGERPNVGVRQRGNDRHEWRNDRREDRQQDRRHDNRPQRDDRTFTSREHDFHERNEMRGYHWGNGRPRDHWDGRRFDHDFFAHRWGREHRFYWNHCQWYGPRYYPGSYFWYNGVYFVIIDQTPDYWNDEEVYVEYIDGYGYALINPVYPGVYYRIDIRF